MVDHEQMEQSPQNSPCQELSEVYIKNKIEKWTQAKSNEGDIELPNKLNKHTKPLRSTYQFNHLTFRKHKQEHEIHHDTEMEILNKLEHNIAERWELIN